MQFFLALTLAIIVSFLAWRFHALGLRGSLAATAVGTIVFGLGGWTWAVLLLVFFISSSALTSAFKNRKRGLVEDYAKEIAATPARCSATAGLRQSSSCFTRSMRRQPGHGWVLPGRWPPSMPTHGRLNLGYWIAIHPG